MNQSLYDLYLNHATEITCSIYLKEKKQFEALLQAETKVTHEEVMT